MEGNIFISLPTPSTSTVRLLTSRKGANRNTSPTVTVANSLSQHRQSTYCRYHNKDLTFAIRQPTVSDKGKQTAGLRPRPLLSPFFPSISVRSKKRDDMKRANTSQRPNRPPECLRLQAAIALSLCRQNGDTCSLYGNVCSLCNKEGSTEFLLRKSKLSK